MSADCGYGALAIHLAEMSRRTIRVVALTLVIIATLVAVLGFDLVTQRQQFPPDPGPPSTLFTKDTNRFSLT